jgi:hypothetical protein
MTEKYKGFTHELPGEGKTNERITPKYLIDALGPFDLDPCAPIVQPWETAKRTYTVRDNGLFSEWHGRVWMNPPYGKDIAKWVGRFIAHGNGIALTFARTETEWFFNLWRSADAYLFIKGRVQFCTVNGRGIGMNAPAPSVLVAIGKYNFDVLAGCGLGGAFVKKAMILGTK